MIQPEELSPATPVAHLVLRVLIVLNWLYCAVILGLLFVAPNEEWILASFNLAPSADADRLVLGMRMIAALGLVTITPNFLILKRLLAIVDTVRAGGAFVAANALRLRVIAWMLFLLQIISILVGIIAKTISTPAHSLHIDAGFSLSGWLGVLLMFVLARVFAEGTHKRKDLEWTV